MTDNPTYQIEIEDDDHNLTATVLVEPFDDSGQHWCDPQVTLNLKVERRGLSLEVTEVLDDEETTELIQGLQQALSQARKNAEARGFYRWVAAGLPDWFEDDPQASTIESPAGQMPPGE